MATYKFIFVKLTGCGPCNKFYESGVWDKLKADANLLSKTSFILYEVKNENNKIVGVDQFYISKAIESGGFPFFYLQKKDDRTIGTFYNQERTFDKMKTWILSTNLDTFTSATRTISKSAAATAKLPATTNTVNKSIGRQGTVAMDKHSDKYDAVRIIHRSVLKNIINKPIDNKITPPTPVAPVKPTISTESVKGTRHTISSLPVPNSITPKVENVTSSSIPLSSDVTTFKPNNYPSTLYEKNLKHPPSDISRPFHPLYASNPDSTKTNEDKDIVTFKFKSYKIK